MKRFTVRLPSTDELFFTDASRSVEISPDGSYLVYLGIRDDKILSFLRPMNVLEATPVQGQQEGAWRQPFFSPDGQWIGFFDASDNWKLKKIPLTGGPPSTICERGTGPGATWGPDETIFFAAPPGLWNVDAEGGEPQRLTLLDAESNEADYRWPHILPDGKTLLVTEWTSDSVGDARIVSISVETGEARTLIEGGTDARFASSGHLVFARAGSLMAVPFDPTSLEVLGSPVPVLERLRVTWTGLADYTVSRDGLLVYVPSRPPSTLVETGRDGTSRILSDGRQFHSPRVSPDGTQVLVTTEEASWGTSWIYNLKRDTMTLVTSGDYQQSPAIWTSDGQRITFVGTNRDDDAKMPFSIYSMAADGSGQAEILASVQTWAFPNSWSPDGKHLAFTSLDEDGDLDISILSPGVEPNVKPFHQTSFWESKAMFSPDGRWLAYSSRESGRNEVYVRPYPGPGEKVQISNNGGMDPEWALDGRELFYWNDNQLMTVPVELDPNFIAGQPSLVLEGETETSSALVGIYDVSPNGNSFIMVQPSTEPPRDIHVVFNWFEELKRIVPTENE